jgi:DNA-binding CsgD family transcriptional regulator
MVGVPLFDASEIPRAKAYTLAVAGEASVAGTTALEAASLASQGASWSLATLALHDAARWGASAQALSQIDAVAGNLEGPLAPLMVEHTRALRANDPAALDAVGRGFEDLGFLLYAAEAFAVAGLVYAAEGKRASAAAADQRANVLADRCEGAVTPALRRRHDRPLTRREEEVAVLASNGLSDKEIAQRLYVSVRTVHAHLRSVYAKLGLAGRDELRNHFDT